MHNATIKIQQRCDAVFGRFYYPIVCLILVLMVIFTAQRGYAFSEAWDEWMVADWLINYAAGFVRRGLSGELILFASDVFGVRANILVFVVFFSLFTILCVLFARLIRNRQNHVLVFLPLHFAQFCSLHVLRSVCAWPQRNPAVRRLLFLGNRPRGANLSG